MLQNLIKDNQFLVFIVFSIFKTMLLSIIYYIKISEKIIKENVLKDKLLITKQFTKIFNLFLLIFVCYAVSFDF